MECSEWTICWNTGPIIEFNGGDALGGGRHIISSWAYKNFLEINETQENLKWSWSSKFHWSQHPLNTGDT